jgi:hypothetical protein
MSKKGFGNRFGCRRAPVFRNQLPDNAPIDPVFQKDPEDGEVTESKSFAQDVIVPSIDIGPLVQQKADTGHMSIASRPPQGIFTIGVNVCPARYKRAHTICEPMIGRPSNGMVIHCMHIRAVIKEKSQTVGIPLLCGIAHRGII